jgi:hypothetical protein
VTELTPWLESLRLESLVATAPTLARRFGGQTGWVTAAVWVRPTVLPGVATLIVGDEVALLFPVIAVSVTVAVTPARLPGFSEM